ncbi:MAG: hypothetical protein P8R01_13850 [Gammaproteobacteria bacterium]|nr:hypothetical protein [Gammaproteobacteria bacterium]
MLVASYIEFGSLIFVLGSLVAAYVATDSYHQGTAFVRHIVLEVGLIGVIIGAIAMLANMSDPEAIFPAVFVMLLVAIYSIFFYGVTSIIDNTEVKIVSSSSIRPSIACGIFTLTVLYAIGTEPGLPAYLNLPSVILVLGGIGIIAGLSKITNQVNVLEIVVRSLPFLGLFLFFVISIYVLTVLDDPRSIGPTLAVSYLSFLYALFLSIVIKLRRPSIVNGVTPIGWSFVGWALVILIFVLGLLLLSFAD